MPKTRKGSTPDHKVLLPRTMWKSSGGEAEAGGRALA